MCCPSSRRPVLAHSGGDGCRILKSPDSTSPKKCFSRSLVGNPISFSGNSHTLLSVLPRPKGLTQCSAWPVAHPVPQPECRGHSIAWYSQPGAATAKKLQGAHCCELSRVTLTPWGGLRRWPRRQAGGCVLTCRGHSACGPLHHCWHGLPLTTLQTHNTFLLFLLWLSFGENKKFLKSY